MRDLCYPLRHRREIKFRWWDKEEKEFNKPWGFRSDVDISVILQSCFEGHIPTQYTGLKDKNGVEIYEGDKIIFDNSDIGGQRYEGVVEWNTDPTLDGLCFGLFIPPDIHGFSGWLSTDFLGDLEVVGNIFEGVYK